MKLRSIPPRTCVTLAHERKLVSVARGRNCIVKNNPLPPLLRENIVGKRGKMRPQISRRPFEEKLLHLQRLLHDLTQFADEGFDVNKLEKETKEQIERLLQCLGQV